MDSAFCILIVDDEADLRSAVASAFAEATTYDCIEAADGQEALERVRQGGVNLVLSDLSMPRMDGARLVEEIARFNPTIPVLIMTSYGSIDGAVELLRKGAYDYITKPFKMQELLQRVGHALEVLELREEVHQLRTQLSADGASLDIVGRSQAMARILKKLRSVARSDASVILSGESGTGKEVIARAIHRLSRRRDHPFVPVHCGALPETLLENELFGHSRGAYTDARSDYPGLIKEADGGTLFLDEIGEINLPTQVKLLRFLQEKEYRPLGSTRMQRANVRIVSATNSNLKRSITAGRFREDLYYRLNIIPITLPPLRERKGDIPLLVNHFLQKQRGEQETAVESVSPLAMQKFMSYDWPGNIRELENKIQQVVALSETSVILPEQIDFGDAASLSLPSGEIKPFKQAKREVVDRFEVAYLTRLLALNAGNISHASRQAGKHRRAFWELMKKHGIRASTCVNEEVEEPEPVGV